MVEELPVGAIGLTTTVLVNDLAWATVGSDASLAAWRIVNHAGNVGMRIVTLRDTIIGANGKSSTGTVDTFTGIVDSLWRITRLFTSYSGGVCRKGGSVNNLAKVDCIFVSYPSAGSGGTCKGNPVCTSPAIKTKGSDIGNTSGKTTTSREISIYGRGNKRLRGHIADPFSSISSRIGIYLTEEEITIAISSPICGIGKGQQD